MAKDNDNDDSGKPRNPVKKVRKILRSVRVAMLTTVAADGSLRSRPMATREEDLDGEIWFFTRFHSEKTEEIQENQKVNVAYVSPKNDRYVSISGTASLVRDAEKVKELWGGDLKAWFPEGKKDPELALLKVTVSKVEYWDASQNRMVDLSTQQPEMRGPHRRPDPVETPAPGGAQG